MANPRTIRLKTREQRELEYYRDHDARPYVRERCGAVLKVAALHEPPLRLLLGSAMYAMGTEADRARAAADAKWQWLSRSVDEPAHGWQTATSNSRLH